MSGNFFTDLWKYRELLLLFSLNEVKLRYRNSVLGFFWAFLEPLLMLGILYFVFTNIFVNTTENFAIFLLLGLIVWYMLSRGTTLGLSSISDKVGLLQKTPIRKEIVVISACLASLIMTAFEFSAFVFFAVIFNFVPPITILLLPLIIITIFIISIGLSFILSALYTSFKDLKIIWQITLQAGFFASPIFYSLDRFPEDIQMFFYLNPMVPILNSVRAVALYGNLPNTVDLVYLLVFTIVILVTGYMIFKIKSRTMLEKL